MTNGGGYTVSGRRVRNKKLSEKLRNGFQGAEEQALREMRSLQIFARLMDIAIQRKNGNVLCGPLSFPD